MGFFSRVFGKTQNNVIAEVDQFGNVFYVPRYHKSFRFDFDMMKPQDKTCAMVACTPLYMVLDKLGSMMSRASLYVVDDKGNETEQGAKVADLLKQPNPLQDFAAFVKEIEVCMKLYGFAAIKVVRGFESAFPDSLWIIPNEMLRLKGNRDYLAVSDIEDVITERYFIQQGQKHFLAPYELAIIADADYYIQQDKDAYVMFNSVSDALSVPVNNWLASMSATHNLLVNGGPKGILSGENTDDLGTAVIRPAEEDEIRNRVRERYGMAGDKWQIMVTRYPLKWQAIDYNADQLKIKEANTDATAMICNAFGLNPNLFTDAKYDNQESAKKSAYQDVIIPDSVKIANVLTELLCRENLNVWLDFSDVECLQKSKQEQANVLNSVSDALNKLLADGLITAQEAREELMKYIDINPTK